MAISVGVGASYEVRVGLMGVGVRVDVGLGCLMGFGVRVDVGLGSVCGCGRG